MQQMACIIYGSMRPAPCEVPSVYESSKTVDTGYLILYGSGLTPNYFCTTVIFMVNEIKTHKHKKVELFK